MTQHNHHHQDHQAHGEQPPHPRKGADGDAHAGHDKHAGHSVASFRDKFWLTLLLTIPTLIWSGMIQHWFDYTAPLFPGSAYIPAVFGTIVYFYGGWPFLRGGYHELRNRLPGMMTLISLAITVAFLYSALVTLGVVVGTGPVVGAGDAGGDHVARPLDRDAFDQRGAGRSQGAREAAA
ncbi:hypothetical protein RLIN73S_00153 [Rhodanobacter lindaniclasticus]